MKHSFPFPLVILFSILFCISQLNADQCQATTKKGAQCKRNVQAGLIYCWQHERMYGTSQTKTEPTSNESKKETIKKIDVKKKGHVSTQCQAITKKGAQCKRKAKAGSSYCWQHGG